MSSKFPLELFFTLLFHLFLCFNHVLLLHVQHFVVLKRAVENTFDLI